MTGLLQADLLAYYADGVEVDAAALVDQAGHAGVVASDLANVGFETGTSITRTEFGSAPFTPAGPTAGSASASQWLFARATVVQATPDTLTDYFGFTVTALPGSVLSLSELRFDRTNRANEAGGIITTYQVFVSVDGGVFTSMGSDSITAPATLSTFLDPATTQITDLSTLSSATSVEFRIALGDNSNLASKSSWVQGIQLSGQVVPEPSAAGLFLLGGLALRFLRSPRPPAGAATN